MVKVDIEIDPSAISAKLQKWGEVKKKGLLYTTEGMIERLQDNSPVDHGVLKGWFVSSATDEEVHIKSPARYAVWVNDGTDPVYPKNAKALVFDPPKNWGGPIVEKGKFKGKVVLHHTKGIKGQHFVEKSIDEVEPQMQGYFLRALYEVFMDG